MGRGLLEISEVFDLAKFWTSRNSNVDTTRLHQALAENVF